MAVLRPTLDELDRLAEPLNDGERRVASQLAELDNTWTVYVQPRIGIERPDFVAVHERHGVCAIEVKDWEYGKYRQADDGSIEYIHGDGVWRRSEHQPRYQAYRYRSTIHQQYFAADDDGETPNQQVRAILILPQFSTKHADGLLQRPQVTPSEHTVRVHGGDALESSIEAIVRGVGCPAPRAESIARLRRELVEPAVPAELREPVWLSRDARNIASNPSNARRRRVRGPAGCGKSFGLAARAAELAARRQRVLVLSYNTTLANYLRTLVTARCRESGADPTLVTCTNFHAFLHRLVDDAELAGYHSVRRTDLPWHEALVEQARHVLVAGFSCTFDAVLVDEGQDFTLDWWNLLREHVVRPDGEMLLVADPTQDVYGQRAWTDEEQMLGAGFSGQWTELKGSYRMPNDIVPIANLFAQRYLEGDRLTAEIPTDQPELAGLRSPTIRHWENVASHRELGTAIGREVVRLLKTHPDLAPNDIVFLCEHHREGLDAVAVLRDAGFPVHHIFGNTDAVKKMRKTRFWPDSPGVKGCTVHSFKGWETPALVMGIGNDPTSRRLAYVAMTRIKVSEADRPSYLSVVNSDMNIAGFDSTFLPLHTLDLPIWSPPEPKARVNRLGALVATPSRG